MKSEKKLGALDVTNELMVRFWAASVRLSASKDHNSIKIEPPEIPMAIKTNQCSLYLVLFHDELNLLFVTWWFLCVRRMWFFHDFHVLRALFFFPLFLSFVCFVSRAQSECIQHTLHVFDDVNIRSSANQPVSPTAKSISQADIYLTLVVCSRKYPSDNKALAQCTLKSRKTIKQDEQLRQRYLNEGNKKKKSYIYTKRILYNDFNQRWIFKHAGNRCLWKKTHTHTHTYTYNTTHWTAYSANVQEIVLQPRQSMCPMKNYFQRYIPVTVASANVRQWKYRLKCWGLASLSCLCAMQWASEREQVIGLKEK